MASPFGGIVRLRQRTAPPEGSSVYPRSAAGTLCSQCRENGRTDGARSGDGGRLGRYLSSCERRGRRAAGARKVLLVCLLARHGRAQLPREDERGKGRGRSGGSRPARRSLPVRDSGERGDLAQVRAGDPARDVPRPLRGLIPGGHEPRRGSFGAHAEPEVRSPADRASADYRRAGLGTGKEERDGSSLTAHRTRYVTIDIVGPLEVGRRTPEQIKG